MANNDELVEQFVDITKDTEDRARFFLEANNWTLEVYNLYRFGFFPVQAVGKVQLHRIDSNPCLPHL